ncbi:MAG: OmpA family protein [Bradymonadia bacterium]
MLSQRNWIIQLMGLCLFLVVESGELHAQHVQLVTQTPTQQSGIVVDGTSTLDAGKYELALGINYARRPVLERFESENQPVYGGVLSPMAALTYGFNERLQLTVLTPWHRITTDSPVQPDTTKAFGVQTRWRIRSAIEGRGLSNALVFGMNAAFEDDANLVSAGGALVYGRVIWQYGFELVRLRLSVGYEHDTSSKTSLVDHAGGAHAVAMGNSIELGHVDASFVGFTELVSKRLLPQGDVELNTLSSEVIAGLRLRSDQDIAMTIAAGRGITDGFGASAMRILFQLNWQFDEGALSLFSHAPAKDRDRDGVPDRVDACADAPEDRDLFQDNDGCPDPDNDRDTIKDSVDRCPNQPEDMDGFDDQDGCPDPDNDGDGVPDISDACPNDDRSSANTTHPNGCPLIQIHGHELKVSTPIQFESGRADLPDHASPILKEVVQFMNTRPKSDRLRVEGYTDLWGTSLRNSQLGKDRAEAVRKALIALGLESERIEAFGRATESPIGDGRDPQSAKRSRRVEFYLSLSERKSSLK